MRLQAFIALFVALNIVQAHATSISEAQTGIAVVFSTASCHVSRQMVSTLQADLQDAEDFSFSPSTDGWSPYPQRYVGDFVEFNRGLYVENRLRSNRQGTTMWFETTVYSICENQVLARGKKRLSSDEMKPVDPNFYSKEPFTLRLNSFNDAVPQGLLMSFSQNKKNAIKPVNVQIFRNANDLQNGKASDSFDMEKLETETD